MVEGSSRAILASPSAAGNTVGERRGALLESAASHRPFARIERSALGVAHVTLPAPASILVSSPGG